MYLFNWVWSNCNYFSRIALELKNDNGRTALELKKVFPQKYHAFERVKRLENTHFLFHLQA